MFGRVATVVALLLATIPFVVLARRWRVADPIVLVLAGLAIGFVPGVPEIRLDPSLILLLFLPPLLYWESVNAPLVAFKRNALWITLLAVGLVFATTAALAVTAHLAVPGIGWAVAFVLGAVLAPTDELAFAPVAERLGVPRRTLAIVGGESLLNDAVSLVLYAVATAAVVSGAFSLGAAAVQFVYATVAAVAIGAAVALIAILAWKVLRDPQLEGMVSLLVPFCAYLPADHLGASGVIATVTLGVIAGRNTPRVMSAQTRTMSIGYWETVVFVANALIFFLVGLQMRTIAGTIGRYPWTWLIELAVIVNIVLIAVRFAWVFASTALFTAILRRPTVPARNLVVVALGGLRGAVSLAAALAIPFTTARHAAFPQRDLIIYLTFTAILVTLVGQGLALPWLIHRLHIQPDGADEAETQRGEIVQYRAALAKLSDLVAEHAVRDDVAHYVRERYESRLRESSAKDGSARAALERADAYRQTESALLEARRKALVALAADGTIDNTVLRSLQRELDLEELELEQMAGRPEFDVLREGDETD